MLTHERKALLLKSLKSDGRIVAKSISRKLKLSEDTIRRDLRELAAAGLLTRVHGGALPASPAIASLASRRNMSVQEKLKLGQAGAKLVTHGATVFVDGGTTNLELVKNLPMELKATVVTHSPAIACVLENHGGVDIILIGGRVFKHSMVAAGTAAHRAIESLNTDIFFMGVTGIHPQHGLTTGDFEEAALKQAIMARAAETVILATSEKLGAVSAHRIGTVAQIAVLAVVKAAVLPDFGAQGPKILRAI